MAFVARDTEEEVNWFPQKRERKFWEQPVETALEFLDKHAPHLKMGKRAIPGAVTVLSLPLIFVGVGLLYFIQAKRVRS